MQLATELRQVQSAGVMEVARATIKANKKVFSFFSDQTYSNKFQAITRELAANAVDSHVMAGIPNDPIEIWLPTELDPVYRVRDHGLGMSHEFMMNNFMCYADGSTKDGDNIAIGGFGIGSKSPFSYVDQFTIRSVYDGTVSVYTVFMDEEGIPSIALLAQQEIKERNGVEVSFPVKNGDWQAFEDAAFNTLRYFEPLPIVHNATKGMFQPPEYVSRGKLWGMRATAGQLNIIMGGVLYPCPTNSLSYSLRNDENLSPLLNYGIDLRLPIGSCDIALSREGLSFSDRTNAAVRKALEDVIDEIADSFSTMFDNCRTEWEAKVLLGNELGLHNQYRYGFNARGKFLQKKAIYKGFPLTPYIQTGLQSIWEIESTQSRRATTSLKSAKWNVEDRMIAPAQVGALIIDDLPLSPKSKVGQKVREYVEEHCTRERSIYVVRLHSHTTLKDFIQKLGNPPYVLTSSMPEPEVAPRTKSANVRPKVRLFTFDGREYEHNDASWNRKRVDNLNPGNGDYYSSGYRKGVKEIAYADQPQTGILVQMENFDLPAGIREKVSSGLIRWDELHFANTSDVNKLKSWKKFEDVWQERLDRALKNYSDLPHRLAVANDPHLRDIFATIRRTEIHKLLNPKQKKTPFGKVCELYEKYVEPLTDNEKNLRPFVNQKMPKGVNTAELLTKLKTNKNLLLMLDLVGSRIGYNSLVLEFI